MLLDENAAIVRAVNFHKIDHIAIAVKNLDQGIDFFCNTLGFQMIRRRVVTGAQTGMVSAEIEHNGIKFVLCQGTEETSQVSRLVDNYGCGVAHIALAVEDVEKTTKALRAQGLGFDTSIIRSEGLAQVFSTRDSNSGLSFEFIERFGEEGFSTENVQQLFEQLEQSGTY